MALPNAATVESLTRCKALPGFFPGGYVDEFLRKLPFESLEGYGHQVQINRVTVLGAVTYFTAGGLVGNIASAVAASPVTFVVSRVGDIVEVDSADIDGSSPENNQLDLQVEMKKVSLLRSLSSAVISGNGVPPNLSGLEVLATGAQVLDLAGVAPTLADYHRIIARVKASDGSIGAGADAIVMHPRTRRQLISLMETSGYGCDYSVDPDLGVPVLHFEGLPVYVSDGVPTNDGAVTDRSSAYPVKLTGPTAIRMLHVGGTGADFGIIVEDVPAQLTVTKSARSVRGAYSLLVPEVACVARLMSMDISGFPD
jgi:hypothetical protein